MSLTASLPTSTWKSLKRVQSHRSLLLLFGDWGVILLCIIAAKALSSSFFYPLAVAIIGARMMGLWALLHDGHHHMLVPSRPFNRRLTEWFIAWPLFRSLDDYDEQHSAHHRHLGSDGDPNVALLRYPEFQFPMKRSQFFWMLLKDLTCFNFLYYRVSGLLRNPTRSINRMLSWPVSRWVYYAVVFAMIAYFGLWRELLFYWVIPFISYFQLLLRMTLIADHCFATEKAPLVRSVELNRFERIFMVPHNLNFHFEHHSFGGIPCYNLKRLHEGLQRSPSYLQETELCRGYWEVVQRVTSP